VEQQTDRHTSSFQANQHQQINVEGSEIGIFSRRRFATSHDQGGIRVGWDLKKQCRLVFSNTSVTTESNQYK
jgi:hypothetical protein